VRSDLGAKEYQHALLALQALAKGGPADYLDFTEQHALSAKACDTLILHDLVGVTKGHVAFQSRAAEWVLSSFSPLPASSSA